MKKRKPELEADLDPPGTRHTRPGGKAAESALKNSSGAPARTRRSGSSSPTRPGATAAERAVAATKGKSQRGK